MGGGRDVPAAAEREIRGVTTGWGAAAGRGDGATGEHGADSRSRPVRKIRRIVLRRISRFNRWVLDQIWVLRPDRHLDSIRLMSDYEDDVSRVS